MKKFLKSFVYAGQGVRDSFHFGLNFKVQTAFALLAIALGFAFSISLTEWIAIVLCIVLVLGAECLNTALESVVDLASSDQHVLARRAKDCAAGAVLICALGSLIIAFIIFLPKLITYIGF